MAFPGNILGSYWLNSTFNDESVPAYNLTNHGVTFDTTTPFLGSGSGVFNGSNAYAEATGINGTLVNGSHSGAIWINNVTNVNAFDTFMSMGIASAGLHGFSLDASNTSFGLRIYIFGNTGTTATVTAAAALLGETGNWVLIGYTLDTIAGLLSLYKNGSSIASISTAVEGLENDAIGLNIGSLGALRYMDGKADAAVFINGAWSAADHLAYYNSGVGVELPVASPGGGFPFFFQEEC